MYFCHDYAYCVVTRGIVHLTARPIISSHILMSRVVGMGPISLSNLVNSAPSAFSSGFHSTDIQTVPRFDVSAVGAEVDAGGGGCQEEKRRIYGTFDIIMEHYRTDSSLCAVASYIRGQTEHNSARLEASVESIII